jgi:uncharacterized delta-60 repeat protein
MRSRAFAHAVVASGCVLAMVSGGVQTASAAPGDLDPSFGGGDGQVTKKFATGGAFVETLALQKDGKILAGGSVQLSSDNWAWILVRYAAAGTLDQSFGTGGKVITDFTAGGDSMESLVVLGNGKIVAAGNADFTFGAIRYTPDGHLDHTFSGDGKVRVNFGPGFDGAEAIARAPGHKLVLAGEAIVTGTDSFALARLTSSGTPDTTFGGDGRVMTKFGVPAYGQDLLVHSDGSLLLAGEVDADPDVEAAVVAYQPNGKLNTGFGDQGKARVDVGKDVYVRAMVQLGTGKLVLGGSIATDTPSSFDIAVLRLKSDGSPDELFGPTGLVSHDFGSSEAAQDIQRAGTKFVLPVTSGADVASEHLGVVRLLANGAPDTGFGDQGLALSRLVSSYAESIAVQTDGRLLVGGAAGEQTTQRLALARFLAS